MRRSRRFFLYLLVVFLIVLLPVIAWVGFYWSQPDPRSLRYALWKRGKWQLDIHTVYKTMVLDTNRDSLVMGRTLEQLQQRFGTIRCRGNLTDYQLRYSNATHGILTGKDFAWLGDTPWAVILENGHVVELHLMKG